ncbi:MAG: HEAT repeat domain-containing protein [Bryobacteraceae bacterium]|jgi:HEAT repeat protein
MLSLAAEIPLERFYDDDPAVRQVALQQFASLPSAQKDAYVPQFAKLLGSGSKGLENRSLLLAFAKIGPVAVSQLLPLLDDPNPGVRASAAEAVAIIRPADPAAVEKLRKMLSDAEFGVRDSAAKSILSMGLGDEKAQSIVSEDTRGDGEPVSAENLVALFTKAGPVSDGKITDWIAALSSDDSFTAFSAVGFLSMVGTPAVPFLLTALKSDNSNTRAGAMQALEGTHLYRSDIEAAAMQALKNDPSARVRYHARWTLFSVFRGAAQEALLQDEIDEITRKRKLDADARLARTRSYTRHEVLASIAADPDHTYPLDVSEKLETRAPDGTAIFAVVYSGKNRGDLLRVWRVRAGRYRLLREDSLEYDSEHCSASVFYFGGKVYLHVLATHGGNGNHHTDEFFRVESGGLTPIKTPKGLPLKLAPDEAVMNGFDESFQDRDLRFAFSIWKKGDGHCCPSAGSVKGKYTIVGNELRYARWTRSKPPG